MKKRVIWLSILLVLIIAGIYASGMVRAKNIVGYKNGHFIARVNICEDYCPDEIMEQSWSRDYLGVESAKECREIGGYPRKSFAWGGVYRGCSEEYIAPQDQYEGD